VLTFKLTASNNLPLSASTTVDITIKPATAPMANAGPNQGVKLPALVRLDGSLSSDPNGLPLTYSWIQVAGPTVTLTGPSTVSPTFTTPSKPSLLGFTLTVNNGLISSTPSLVTVTVNAAVNDSVIITLAEYRLAQQRLTINATSNIADGSPVLTVQGYGPNKVGVPMTYAGGGLYTLVLTGVAQPDSVTVTSSFGGTATSGLTRIR
jgi:hypothetical protein